MDDTKVTQPDDGIPDLLAGPPILEARTVRLTPEAAVAIARAIDAEPLERPAGAVEGVPVRPSRRFFYPDSAPGRSSIVIERTENAGTETFRLLQRIGYVDKDLGALLVPRDPRTFTTDLASVPRQFTWLVPVTGVHLPAVLLHDGLVVKEREKVTHIGPAVPREVADRILRDAMGELGTSFLQRWMMWAATAIATAWSQPDRRKRWQWRIKIVATMAVIAVLGALATVDVLDIWDVVPWMGDRSWPQEIALGTLGAFVVPSALATGAWGGQRLAGVIAGIALAFLLHVTFAVVLVSSLYILADALVNRPAKPISGRQMLFAVGGIVAAGVVPLVFGLVAVAVGD